MFGINKNGTKHKLGIIMPAFFPASRTTYDNTTSGLSATRVQGAIDAVEGQIANSSDAYSDSKAYAVGDYCIYNDTLYRCITACTAASWSVNSGCFAADTVVGALNGGLWGTPGHVFGAKITAVESDNWRTPARGILTVAIDTSQTVQGFYIGGGADTSMIMYPSSNTGVNVATVPVEAGVQCFWTSTPNAKHCARFMYVQ